ncbi:MAG TPA: hypothetical protein VF043_04775 [Ktedonobacteraceae bacterium]
MRNNSPLFCQHESLPSSQPATHELERGAEQMQQEGIGQDGQPQ